MTEITEIRLRDELMLDKLHEHFLDLVDEVEATKECPEGKAISLMARFYYLKEAVNDMEKRLTPRIGAAYRAYQNEVDKNARDIRLLKKVAKAIVSHKESEIEKEASETILILDNFRKQTQALKQTR